MTIRLNFSLWNLMAEFASTNIVSRCLFIDSIFKTILLAQLLSRLLNKVRPGNRIKALANFWFTSNNWFDLIKQISAAADSKVFIRIAVFFDSLIGILFCWANERKAEEKMRIFAAIFGVFCVMQYVRKHLWARNATLFVLPNNFQ